MQFRGPSPVVCGKEAIARSLAGIAQWNAYPTRAVLAALLSALYLIPDRQYSCAYFETPQESLDDAQLAKKRHLAAKLLLEDGHRLLDIGCGWGGLALYAAEVCDARVTGITLSQEQLAIARQRAKERKLDGSATFQAPDYRDVTRAFHRIVSVGMFEH